MIVSKPNFFLVTGGPGVGKTALIDHLRAHGERCVEETHRRVIRDQIASGGSAVPWIDPQAYGERTAREDIAIFDAMVDVEARVFFDRGIPDSAGPGLTRPDWFDEAMRTRRYNATVFIPPPWRRIFAQDAERKQTFDEAVRVHERILGQCQALGYRPMILPLASVKDRAAFVLAAADQVSTKARSST